MVDIVTDKFLVKENRPGRNVERKKQLPGIY
jgi:hypothetical protein